MSKAPRPPKEPPIPTPSDDPETPDTERRCWDFAPDEPGAVNSKINVGNPIRGNLVGKRIQLNSNSGFIGYVPNPEASEIIEYVRGKMLRLAGQVIDKQEGLLLIKLCAI